MQEAIANLVHPIINRGLRLKERLEQGEKPDLDTEQAALRGLLLDMEARRLPDFGGDSVDQRISRVGDPTRRGGDSFLGIRYALVCWLDEIFTDSPWGPIWTDQSLETALFGTRLRAELFWEQARRAEARSGSDALEAFYLCVVLGFRGELRDQPEHLQNWVSTAQTRIARGKGQELIMPPEHEPTTNVPPRHGRERFQRMIVLLGISMLVLITVAGALVTYLFAKNN